ncbi:hypothetical protein K7X08_011367 [Anisodus acutangulus]|uniref:Uncharacterized protein n=1 Tax=Anisodus acutangulus TaxID=402998 RepID=A0A9Q1MMM1_9SOLA|nr:hypothetical protein K7X08_011367 [Anisodus acutangulus]
MVRSMKQRSARFADLIQQNKSILEGKIDFSDAEISIPKERAIAHYNQQVAGDNLNVLGLSARELLSVLGGVFLESSKDTGGSLQSTISELAYIADKEEVSGSFLKKREVVSRFFKTTMRELKKAQNARSSNSMQIDDSSSESVSSLMRAQLSDLAVSLLPGLDAIAIDELFDYAIEPALKDEEGLIQKKAYKALFIILSIGHACGDEEKGGRKEDLQQFFNMVAGGLAGETPHMISAAVKGLARLAYEFTDLVSAAHLTYLTRRRQGQLLELLEISSGSLSQKMRQK